MPPVSSRTQMKSVPRTTSARSGERSARASNSATGRRLANSPSDLRIRSSPCSGRTFAVGSLSYLGSPMAPNSKTDGVRLVGIGVAHGVDGRGAHQCGTVFDLVSEFFRHAVQHFRGFGDDLGTDAVAG